MAKPSTPRNRARRPKRTRQATNLWGKDTLTIERMSQEGRGIAMREGKVVFVSGALTAEQVQVQCTGVKRDYDEARMIQLAADSAPSTARTEPPCPIYNDCGGCSLQHWSVAAQQQHKQATLQSMLQKITRLTLDAPILSAASGFRHRLRLLVTRDPDRHYLLALRQNRSHQPVNVQHCLVADNAVNTLLRELPGKLLAAPDLQGLREIEIDADSDNAIGLCFYFAAHPGEKTLVALSDALLSDSITALRVRLIATKKDRSDSYDDEPDGSELALWQELLAQGELHLRQPATSGTATSCPNLVLGYLPGDFTQTQWDVNSALVERALDWLKPTSGERALDLFSGIGNFSLPLARLAKTVHAFESDSAMTARVIANAQGNDIENVSATTLNLMTDELVLPRADIAIVDPPRAGAKTACEALIRAKVKRVLYVSCHPATLMRDARIFQAAGYRLAKAAAVDMFPHTGHSEAMVLFQRK